MDASSLIKVLMVVGFFHGDSMVGQETVVVSQKECEAAQSTAVEFNSRASWFWEDDVKERVEVMCLRNPNELEA